MAVTPAQGSATTNALSGLPIAGDIALAGLGSTAFNPAWNYLGAGGAPMTAEAAAGAASAAKNMTWGQALKADVPHAYQRGYIPPAGQTKLPFWKMPATGGTPATRKLFETTIGALPKVARFAGPAGAAYGVGDLAYRGTSALLGATGGEEALKNLGGNIYEYFNQPESFVMPESGLDEQGRTISPVSTAPGYGVPEGYEVIGTSPEEQLAFVIDPLQDARISGQLARDEEAGLFDVNERSVAFKGNAVANALSPLYDSIFGREEEVPWEYRFGEPGYRENLGGYYPAAPPLDVTNPYTETYRSDILPRTSEDFTKVITGPSGKYVQGYDVGAGPFAQVEQELLDRQDKRQRQGYLNVPSEYYTGAEIKRYGDLGTLEETINAPRIDIYPDDRTVFSGGVKQVIEPSRGITETPIAETIQPNVEYMEQGAHPWSALLGALYGEEIGTTPHLGGVVWERGDEGAWTGRPPERFLDYPGDTPEERVQEQRDMLALQREMTGYVPPERLGQIFRGDTGVGTDLQFTPEEAMTSNISNALMSAAQGGDVQPELQAIVDMSYADPVLNDEEMFFEKYLDPTRQEAIDITSQVESFSALQEADQQRMEREAAQERADNKRRADEEAARQEQVREDNQRRAEEAREAQDRARENKERQEAQAARVRAIAERSKAADDRKAAARAQRAADRAAQRERQATIQRQEDNRRRQATERAAKQAEQARKAAIAAAKPTPVRRRRGGRPASRRVWKQPSRGRGR